MGRAYETYETKTYETTYNYNKNYNAMRSGLKVDWMDSGSSSGDTDGASGSGARDAIARLPSRKKRPRHTIS